MTVSKQLGVFWGSDALYFVQADAESPLKLFSLPFPFSEGNREPGSIASLSLAGAELSSTIQKTLRKQKITATTVNLSLPTKDIIFRSFNIPWMQPHEIKNVVEFEASKYIPFPLEDLSFSFHSANITENNMRRIRIIFVAIRTDVLDNYTAILKNATLDVNVIEPAASSLIRLLSSKNLIPTDQTVALIEKENVGRIIVMDQGVPQFVREFHVLPGGADNKNAEGIETAIKKLTKEVRISIDYFGRQNEQLSISQLFLMASSGLSDSMEIMEQDLNIPVVSVDDRSVLGNSEQSEVGFLNAYGAGVIPFVNAALNFNLSEQKANQQNFPKPAPRKPIDFKSFIKTALVCIPAIVLSVITSGFLGQKSDSTIQTLNQKLGRFQSMDISILEKQEIRLKTKLAYFQNTRQESDAAVFLLLIPPLLPEGAWLQNLDITYDDSSTLPPVAAAPETSSARGRNEIEESNPLLKVTIDGYAYSEDKNKQFRLVNMLLQNLKEDSKFAAFFDTIDLTTTRAQKLDERAVTAFTIVCIKDNENKAARPQ